MGGGACVLFSFQLFEQHLQASVFCGPLSMILGCGNLTPARPPAADHGHVCSRIYRWHFSHLAYTFLHCHHHSDRNELHLLHFAEG